MKKKTLCSVPYKTPSMFRSSTSGLPSVSENHRLTLYEKKQTLCSVPYKTLSMFRSSTSGLPSVSENQRLTVYEEKCSVPYKNTFYVQ